MSFFDNTLIQWLKSGTRTDVSAADPMPVLLSPDSSSAAIDAFSRSRVSSPLTLFDGKQIFDNLPLLWDDQETSGSGTTSTYTQDKASTTITVALNTAGARVRQTFMRFNYQPGKSTLILMTGTLGITGGGTGIQRCMGQYDDANGIFARDNEGIVEFVIRSSTSGSAVDTAAAQSTWNIDKLDGTGASGKTLDSTKSQILVVDYEWLGVGRVRAGFVIDGVIIYAHEFNHANEVEGVYMTVANNPLRYEIINDGTGAASDLECICATVISEGGSPDTGVLRYQSTAGTQVVMNTTNTLYAILGIRLKSTHLASTVKLVKAAVALQSNSDDIEWVLLFDPTVAGAPVYSSVANSSVEYFVGATANTVTNGFEIDGGYISSGSGSSASGGGSERLENAILLGSYIDGTQQSIVLCARPINGSATAVNVEGGITWRELS